MESPDYSEGMKVVAALLEIYSATGY